MKQKDEQPEEQQVQKSPDTEDSPGKILKEPENIESEPVEASQALNEKDLAYQMAIKSQEAQKR